MNQIDEDISIFIDHHMNDVVKCHTHLGEGWLGFRFSVKIVTEILTAPYRGKYRSDFFGPVYDPPAFDGFYPDKYSHEFSNFTDIIIQFF